MAEPQDTREEQKILWAAQRVTYAQELHDSQAEVRRRVVREVIVAGIVIIVVVVVAVVLL